MKKIYVFNRPLSERLKTFKFLRKMGISENSGTLPFYTDFFASDNYRGFNLGDGFSPSNRFHYCHESELYGEYIKNEGWKTNDGSEVIKGVVFCLPGGNFLAGWSLGQGKSSRVAKALFKNEFQAWIHADYLAKQEANNWHSIEAETVHNEQLKVAS